MGFRRAVACSTFINFKPATWKKRCHHAFFLLIIGRHKRQQQKLNKPESAILVYLSKHQSHHHNSPTLLLILQNIDQEKKIGEQVLILGFSQIMINNLPTVQLWDFKFKYNKNTLYQTVYKFGKQFRLESNCEYCIFSGGSKPSNEGGPCQPDP